MKTTFSIAAVLTLILAPALHAVNEKEEPKSAVIWQDDPLCQFVFFAVLEGLYRDGVQNEIVDLIIGEPIKNEEEKVKSMFVFRCELCHATYEAFRTYRARPVFKQTNAQSTFGKGVDPKMIESLKSTEARDRVYAMGGLVRPWIMHRIEETRKTDEEKKAMQEEFFKYLNEGEQLLSDLQDAKDPHYLDWYFYGVCQACEAAKDLGQ